MLKQAIDFLVPHLVEITCKISKKTVVIASRKEHGIQLSEKRLQSQEVKSKFVKSAKDSGVDAKLGNKGIAGATRKRLTNASVRAHRAGQLTKVNKKARALDDRGARALDDREVRDLGDMGRRALHDGELRDYDDGALQAGGYREHGA